MTFTIFLDMDGVLTNYENVKKHQPDKGVRMSNRCPLDPQSVKWFNKIVEEFDIDIVMSSTWRYYDTIEDMRKMLKNNKVKGKLAGYTPATIRSVRGPEIKQYIEEYKIKHYYVIDDEIFDIDNVIPESKIIHIDSGWLNDGFNESHYKILRKKIIKEIKSVKS